MLAQARAIPSTLGEWGSGLGRVKVTVCNFTTPTCFLRPEVIEEERGLVFVFRFLLTVCGSRLVRRKNVECG